MTKSSLIFAIPAVLVIAVTVNLMAARSAQADDCPGAWQWCDTLGGVDLYAASVVLPQWIAPWWQGTAESDASSAITTIVAQAHGWELCNGDWSSEWFDYDSQSNAIQAAALGWAYHSGGCQFPYCVKTEGSHSFHKSGSFGASPYTENYDCV